MKINLQSSTKNKKMETIDVKEWLQENSIPFIMKDVADEWNLQQFRKYNESIIPVLIIKDYKQKTETKVISFNSKSYEKMLKQKNNTKYATFSILGITQEYTISI
ncbi:hypothetical protein [Bacillus sp. AY18-3]|uniref:hypothetical protein n=1 Tax=Bacillus sp. AY18-3 TaxID=2217814 RepID=UPI002103C3DE|nr:hypothetical protein [Bacillus sp. AY18-3]